MNDISFETVYEPPEVDVLHVQVERGFYGSGGGFGGGGGSTTPSGPSSYDVGGGATAADWGWESGSWE